jgi:hypothetical protein
VQVAVQIQLQQIARIVTRPARLRCLGSLEAEIAHRQTADESIDHPAHMIGWHQIIQHHRKQRPLTPALAQEYSP